MIYHGTYSIERIAVHPMDNMRETQFIELTKSADSPTFWVTCSCDKDWFWEFYMTNNSDYERVKLNIMDAIFECDDMDALMAVLSEVFMDGFGDMLVKDECDGDCENCELNKNEYEN